MEVEDDEGTTKANETRRSRKQGPLRLVLAWIISKDQDQTYNKPVVSHLGKDEKSQGLSCTSFSELQG